MDSSKQYLATNVLSERKVVTYRSLSRALKVHVSEAKQFLKEFHDSQNAKNPKTVNATYLVTGVRKPEVEAAEDQEEEAGDQNGVGDEDHMQVDDTPVPSFLVEPPPDSTPQVMDEDDDIPTTTIMIVKEEELEDAKKDFQNIISVQVYSLQPSTPKDIHIITAANDPLYLSSLSEEPDFASKTFGTIFNPHVKRRTLQSNTSTTSSAPLPVSTTPITIKREDSTTSNSGANKPKSTAGTGALFSSFAKAKPKAKAPSPPPKPKEDETMKDVFDDDDDEEEEEQTPVLAPTDPAVAETARKARLDREAKLRAMMEESDSELESEVKKPIKEEDDDDEPMADAEEPPVEDETAASALDAVSKTQDKEPTPPSVTTGDGRRRGRRRVTKKKTFQDEKGYFVTREVEEWEDFSESETEKPAAKAAFKPSKTSDAAKRKSTGASGKGNIMSFFGKKQ